MKTYSCPGDKNILSMQPANEHMRHSGIKLNDYVVVEVLGKKNVKQYLGNVTSLEEDYFQVRFMKRCPDSKNKFVFTEESEAVVAYDELICILEQPKVNNRFHYIFDAIPTKCNLV